MRNQTLKQIPVYKDKWRNQHFMRYTGIDLAKSKGEDFKNKKYTKKENENDVFVFIKKNQLIGVLKGIKQIKDVDCYNFYYDGPINWKNLKEVADHIIRVPKEELIYRPKSNWSIRKEKTPTIHDRLEKYKKEKYSYITPEQIEEMFKRVSIGSTLFVLEENTEPAEKEIRKIIWYYGIKTDVTRHLAELLKIYKDYKKQPDSSYRKNELEQVKVDLYKMDSILKKYGYIK